MHQTPDLAHTSPLQNINKNNFMLNLTLIFNSRYHVISSDHSFSYLWGLRKKLQVKKNAFDHFFSLIFVQRRLAVSRAKSRESGPWVSALAQIWRDPTQLLPILRDWETGRQNSAAIKFMPFLHHQKLKQLSQLLSLILMTSSSLA